MIAGRLATTQIWKMKNQEIIIIIIIIISERGWNGTKVARFSGANVVQSSQILLLRTKRPWSFLVGFFGKRPQTYSSGNFVWNNPYQRGGWRGIFFLSSTYLDGQNRTNLHKPKNLPSKLKSPLCIFQRIGLLGRVLSKVFYKSHRGKNFALSWNVRFGCYIAKFVA